MKPISFIKSVINEMKLVEWISLNQTAQLTLIVMGVAIFLGGLTAILDILFLKLRNIFI